MFLIGYIYKQNLFSLFIFTIIFIFLWSIIALLSKKHVKISNVLLLSVNIIVLIYMTLISRTSTKYEVQMIPFYTFILAKNQPELYRSFFMNCLLFVPLGLSMPYILSKKPYKRNIFITICFALVLSFGIELLQYCYHLGQCETDDVIANTFGAAVGTISYLLYIRILKIRKENLMDCNISENQKILLNLCGKSLFGKKYDLPANFNVEDLIDEAIQQTVLPTIYPSIKTNADSNTDKLFSQIIAKNMRVEFAHNEVHQVLFKNNIPYTVIKGVASASYYKEPMIRMMGDVDVLVSPDNILSADAALRKIGFVTSDRIDNDSMHISYKRNDGMVCELHRHINGIPKNETGDIINKYLTDIIEKSACFDMSNGSCVVPSLFHHGLILLLHTASHLTSEGVGLRHLCDWAVFINSLSNEAFLNAFEKPLKQMGLWRFAQLLTLCCVKYLGCVEKEWAGTADDSLLDEIIIDILNGGNFGKKDTERYSQIKYISDRETGEKGKKSLAVQLMVSINQKSKNDFKFINKYKFLLPIGWIMTICKYFYLVIIGKRNIDGVSTVLGAKQRKELYKEFELFKNDQV